MIAVSINIEDNASACRLQTEASAIVIRDKEGRRDHSHEDSANSKWLVLSKTEE